MLTGGEFRRVGLDGVALKPTECDLRAAVDALDPGLVAVDYEGAASVPDRETLAALAAGRSLYVTAPVRADGFDPHGDDAGFERVPRAAGLVLVAGNAAYLDETERGRAVAPRLRAALDAYDREATPWVGTEGIERLAMAAGGVQYDLLGRRTESELRALRTAGYDGRIAVYAPTLVTGVEDEVLDALGGYVARRRPVRAALPEDCPTDARADGGARDTLLTAAEDYALVGDVRTVRERVENLHAAGADLVVGYPAGGVA